MSRVSFSCVVFLVVVCCQFVYAAHYIVGNVEDALDGESADDKTVVLWNHVVGISSNITDVIGVNGNSGTSNIYMIDCELLSEGCAVGDVLSVKVDDGDYVSWIENVTVTGAGYDTADNLSLNSPPVSILVSPLNGANVSANVYFNCSFSDYDDNIERVALWGNWSGTWEEMENHSVSVGESSFVFSDVLSLGNYKWNCFVEDDLSIGGFNGSNNSFFVDDVDPIAYDVVAEDSEICGFGSIEVNCSAYDVDLSIDSVIIQSVSPLGALVNYSASWYTGDVYSASIDVDSSGNWSFSCIVNDSVGNVDNSSSGDIVVFSGNAELSILDFLVTFDVVPSMEGEVVNVSVNVTNDGCVSADNFVVGFFDGTNFDNKTVSIENWSSLNVSALWSAKIGLSNISVYVDFGESIVEDNESNNMANDFLYLKAWQGIYGNLSLDKVLMTADNLNLSFWLGEDDFHGSIFIADSESQISWKELQAVGRMKNGNISSDDFSEIDSLLGMSEYNDSVYDLFTSSGSPNMLDNISIFQGEIVNIPFINSSTDENFTTGILWDMSDSGDSEYDSSEGEDLVFVSEINRGVQGGYGVYDYEINIPVKLRSYDATEESKVYLYYDLS